MKTNALLVLASGVLLTLLAACATRQQQPLSHFKCYEVEGEEPNQVIVNLTDQFGTARTAVGRPKYLCAPAKKEIIQGQPRPTPANADHLVCYAIAGNQATSRTIDNQLQKQDLAILRPQLLCVPTEKTERKPDESKQ